MDRSETAPALRMTPLGLRERLGEYLAAYEDTWRCAHGIDDNFKEDGKWEELGMARLMKRVNYERLGEYRAAGARRPRPEVRHLTGRGRLGPAVSRTCTSGRGAARRRS